MALPTKVLPVNTSKSKDAADRPGPCKFCSKIVCGSKLLRHMIRRHANEEQVKPLLSLKKPQDLKKKNLSQEELSAEKERVRKVRAIMAKLRLAGENKYNQECLAKSEGELLVAKRPPASQPQDMTSYGPCPDCLRFMKKSSLASHVRLNCPGPALGSSRHKTNKTARRRVQMESELLMPSTAAMSEEFRTNVISKLNPGILTGIITKDSLIILRGETLYRRHRHLPARLQYIRCKLREVARLFFHVHQRNPEIKSVEDMLSANRFDILIEAVDVTCGLDSKTNHYKTPSLALKLGYELKKYAMLLQKKHLLNEDEEKIQKIVRFLEIMKFWSEEVSAFALRTLRHKKATKPLALPLAKDLKKLHDYLKTEREKAVNELDFGDIISGHNRLSKVLMAQIVLFNRKRACEVQCIKVQSFTNRKAETHSEILDMLNEGERRLVRDVTLLKTEGKNEQMVPVLLTKSHVNGIQKILSVREEAAVHPSNEYLFPNSTVNGHRNVSRVLSQFCVEAKLECPDNITTRSLRRHVATMAQILALGDEGVQGLSRFLSHTGRVHEQFYRLPEDTMLLAKTSKILFAMESGISKYAGKSLDDIDIDTVNNVEDVILEETADDEDDIFDLTQNTSTVVARVEEDLPEDENFDYPVSSDEEDFTYTPSSSFNGRRGQRPSSTPRSRNKSKGKRLNWSEEQKSAMIKFFATLIKDKTGSAPKNKCVELINKSSGLFHNKTPENIRNFVNNRIRGGGTP